MTPAINALKRAKIDYTLHQYEHDNESRHFGEEAAAKLGIEPTAMYKTLIACDEHDPKKMVVAVVPVAGHLDLKKLAKVAKIKKMRMADPDLAEKTTGYVKGGISPLGQKKRLPIFFDQSVQSLTRMYVSGGKRGLTLEVEPLVVIQLLHASMVSIAM